MKNQVFAVFILSVFSLCIAEPNKCDQGSEYWCQNTDTARECGVLEFCKLKNAKLNEENVVVPPAVKVELYYESLCGGCRAFIMGQLYPTFQKLKNSGILDIGLYPYGNARESQQGQEWNFQCQHGQEECVLNLVETCALHLLIHPAQFMPYIHCVESNPSMASAVSCATQLKIEWGPINACVNGSQGNHLEHEMAVKTNALSPPHQYVPWIVVNGVHTDAIQESAQSNLMHLVCQTYTGVKPHACRVAETDKNGRCFRD